MVRCFAEALMGAEEADALPRRCRRERTPERANRRNGYRERDWDTRRHDRPGGAEAAPGGELLPRLALQPRRRAEQAFVSVIAEAYLAGVSTRRVEKLVQQLGVERMSKSQVSRLATSLDPASRGRTRPLEGAPYPYVCWTRSRSRAAQGGRRMVNVCVVHAVAVNRDGFRGRSASTCHQARTAPTGPPSARPGRPRPAGVVTSDVHPGLDDVIAATLLGACWQRCRTHFMPQPL